jgi:hypothetical protein
MFRLVYVSSAVNPFSKQELLDLLAKSRANNERLDITGMLLYKDGDFMQLLEGDEQAVRKLYAVIAKDPRHEGTITLVDEAITERLFANWSMAFRDLNDAEVRQLPGFSPFMNRVLRAESFHDDPTGCLEMLRLFRDSR